MQYRDHKKKAQVMHHHPHHAHIEQQQQQQLPLTPEQAAQQQMVQQQQLKIIVPQNNCLARACNCRTSTHPSSFDTMMAMAAVPVTPSSFHLPKVKSSGCLCNLSATPGTSSSSGSGNMAFKTATSGSRTPTTSQS